MLITYNPSRQRFEVQSTYAERLTVNPMVKDAGFSFDFDGAKVWHSQNYYPKHAKAPRTWDEQIVVATKLSDYFDDAAKQAAGQAAIEVAKIAAALKQESLETSRATDADIDIPRPEGLEYLPFQKAGIAYAIKRKNTLFADEMGLGKTIEAIGVANVLPDARHLLIICKAKLKLNWMREFIKWDVYSRTVGVLTKPTKKAKRLVEKYGQGRVSIISTEGPFDVDVIVANFDMVTKCNDALRAEHWNILIVDESQMVRNLTARRSQVIFGHKETKDKKTGVVKPAIAPIVADHNLFLTGTPIMNRPKELWPIIQRFDPDGLGKNFFKYAMRYCGAKHNGYGWDFGGSSNLDELQQYLRSLFMVRRLKADVMKELPPKRRSICILETPDGYDESITERENKEFDALTAGGLSYEDIPFTAMSAVRQDVAISKVPSVIEFLEDTLDEVEKVVVFAHHKEVIRQFAEKFGDAAVTVDGETLDTEALEAQDRFQQDPNCKVFIGSILASGAGLTLTAAHTIVFAEMDWVPGNNVQAEDRCHRYGQHDSLNIYYLVLDGSVDARIVEIVLEKQAVIQSALDTKHEPRPTPEVGYEPPKPKLVEQGVQEAIPTLPGEQVKAIHQALRMLADVCDGAFAIDGQGFNKFDSTTGKRLANTFMLTPKQALAGQKLVRKYQRQLPVELIKAAGIEPVA
jgi:SNF2 family DNA or RNA helicase